MTTAAPVELKYGDTLWGSMRTVVAQAEEGERNLKNLVRFMREKSALDALYASKLRKMAVRAVPEVTEQTVGSSSSFLEVFALLQQALHAQADGMETVSGKTTEQIVKPLTSLIDSHSVQVTKMKESVSHWNKRYTKSFQSVQAAKANNQRQCLASARQRLKLSELEGNFESKQDKEAVLNSAVQATRKALVTDKAYINSVTKMRTLRGHFDGGIKTLFNQFQQTEYERMTLITQFMRHFFTLETSQNASEHKYLIELMATLQDCAPANDIQSFITRHRTKKKPPQIPEYETFLGHPAYSSDVNRRLLVPEDSDKSFVLKQAEDRLSGMLEQLVRCDGRLDEDLPELLQLLTTQSGRTGLVNMLQRTVVKARKQVRASKQSSVIEEFEVELLCVEELRPDLGSEKMLDSLGGIMTACLDACCMAVQTTTTTTANNADDDNNDTIVNEEGKGPDLVEVQTPVQLLTLSDLFYISGQEGKIATTTTATPTPTTTTTTTTATTTAATTATATTAKRRTVQSLSSFRNHKVWQAESVWEAALKKRVVQRLTELREGEPDHDTKRQVAFSCLSVFAHTMALGFALPVTMVQAFILKHAVELDLSGEQMAVLGRLDCLRETTSKTNTTGSTSSS